MRRPLEARAWVRAGWALVSPVAQGGALCQHAETRGSDRPLIREIEIEGFKSIERLKLELGRVTVLIGENGCGKSNILEAIAFASAACTERLDHEFLASRGIRTTDPVLMRSRFTDVIHTIAISIRTEGKRGLRFLLAEDASSAVPKWKVRSSIAKPPDAVANERPEFIPELERVLETHAKSQQEKIALLEKMTNTIVRLFAEQAYSS